MKSKLQQLEALFNLQHQADLRALKMWQEKTGKKLTIPDRADMVVFLLGEMDKLKFISEEFEDYKKRIELLNQQPKDHPEVTTFAEIKVTEEQMEIMAEPMFGCPKETLMEYYKGKIHGNLLLTISDYVTREDQPDFQYLFDLGVQALKAGMELEKK